jgi:uncharacterized glyoxalase superfamily protein PhnB
VQPSAYLCFDGQCGQAVHLYQLIGSGAPPDRSQAPTTAIRLNPSLDDPEGAECVLRACSEEGNANMPFAEFIWPVRSAMLVDPFGMSRMVNFEKKA